MAKNKQPKYLHPVHAYMYIGLAIGASIWLVSLANPNKVSADNDVPLNEIVTAKDTATEIELLKPDVVMPTETDPKIINQQIKTIEMAPIPEDVNELSVTILPTGLHQSINSVVTVIFSNPVSLKSFKDSFTIVPNVVGSFSVNGRVGTFVPQNHLETETEYRVQINTNVVGLKGEKLNNPVATDFTTRPDVHVLAVPYYRQQYSRSCEAASLKMAFAYLGTVVTEKEIVDAAGYQPREPNWSKLTWDDPYSMFVGFLDGKKVGYGMYASALGKASSALGHSSRVLKNPTSTELAEAVWNDNPVVIWGYIKGTVPKLSYFHTDEGKRIPIYSNEHARVIVGVVGSVENPIGFYVHDPLSGLANEYWSADDLQKHMSIFGGVSNQALVVE